MTAAQRAQVAVVGGGPAGSATACLLARAGVDVLLVDRAQFPRDKPCAEYLSPQAARILHQMGVLEKLELSGGAQLTGMDIRAPNGSIIRGEFVARHGFRGFRDRGLALRRTILDATLLEAARAAGARVLERTQVRDLLRDGRGRVIGLAALSRDGHPVDYHADLVVGADGLRSVVGRRAGLIRVGRHPHRVALVTHYEGVDGMTTHGEMHVAPRGRGYLGLAPVGGGLVNVAVVVPTARKDEIRGHALRFLQVWIDALPHLATRFANARPQGSVLAVGPFNSRASVAWQPGLALVGDAADFYDPFTGEGIYAALRGGELLSLYATEAVRATNARSADIALAAYDRARKHEFSGKWRVERLIGLAVEYPALLNRVARSLHAQPDMADLLVGVAGDFVPPRQVLRLPFLLRLFLGGRGTASPGATPSEHPAATVTPHSS
ncbi:MAG: NAD(P)/FAD-dependent oxidoreductase [Gemmatimonadaceae bacterium]